MNKIEQLKNRLKSVEKKELKIKKELMLRQKKKEFRIRVGINPKYYVINKLPKNHKLVYLKKASQKNESISLFYLGRWKHFTEFKRL